MHKGSHPGHERHEPQRPGTIAHVLLGSLRAFPPLYRISPAPRAEEPVEPMPATEHDRGRVRTGVTGFPDERRPCRPIDVGRHVRLAAEATRPKGCVRSLLAQSGIPENDFQVRCIRPHGRLPWWQAFPEGPLGRA